MQNWIQYIFSRILCILVMVLFTFNRRHIDNERGKKSKKSDEIKEFGALMLNENKKNYKIRLLTIIGEIEGHETVSNNTKATKYEHLLPQLAEAEESDEVEGVLILLNTLGEMWKPDLQLRR